MVRLQAQRLMDTGQRDGPTAYIGNNTRVSLVALSRASSERVITTLQLLLGRINDRQYWARTLQALSPGALSMSGWQPPPRFSHNNRFAVPVVGTDQMVKLQADHTIQLGWLRSQLVAVGVYAFLMCILDTCFRMDCAAALGEVPNHPTLMRAVTITDNRIAAITADAFTRYRATCAGWSFDGITHTCSKSFEFTSARLDELLLPNGLYPLVGLSYILHHVRAIQAYIVLVGTEDAFVVLPEIIVDALLLRMQRALGTYQDVLAEYDAVLSVLSGHEGHKTVTISTTHAEMQTMIDESVQGRCPHDLLVDGMVTSHAAHGVAGPKSQFLPFAEASQYMGQFALNNREEFRAWCMSEPRPRPANIPYSADKVYGFSGERQCATTCKMHEMVQHLDLRCVLTGCYVSLVVQATMGGSDF